ncbi:RibD family protein [Pseudonocardia broussonetiae]|uniref:RibD family protein n=1 Tax=Pseudonocardia broussonetiae TaxID=2736640 RepID=UPI003083F96E
MDDATPARLVLSGPEDLDRVDDVRAGVDAILVGAGTVRADDPRLLVRSAARRDARVARGLPETPLRVVLSRGGPLDPAARVFTGPPTLVLTTGAAPDVPAAVETVSDLPAALALLHERGVRRLLVEGGAAVHTAFLAAGLVDELHLAVAPLLVGSGPPFVHPAAFPADRWRLAGVDTVGDVAVLRLLRGPA